jgi:hypothetical protein
MFGTQLQLASRFWDHMSDHERDCLMQDESTRRLDMLLGALVHCATDQQQLISPCRLRHKAEALALRRRWVWWRTSKYIKKWLYVLQTAAQLEFSFQGLCRQVLHEQVCICIVCQTTAPAPHLRL